MIKLSVLFSVKYISNQFDCFHKVISDIHEIGFVRDVDMQTLMELTSSVGIELNFDW